MLNLTWANQMAKAALRNAQQKIDSVLDIHPESLASLNTESSSTLDTEELSSITPNVLEVQTDFVSSYNEDQSQLSLLDSFLYSIEIENESEELSKIEDPEVGEMDEKDSPISSEPVLPPLGSCRSSQQDETLTVVSSDIEVIRQVDAWSVSSSKLTNEEPSATGMYKNDSISLLQSELKKNKHRQNELKTISDALHKRNSNLQVELTTLGDQMISLKNEIAQLKKEKEEILDEGKRMSDYSAKQSKEIRRLKNEMGELTKIKNDNKRLKEEKAINEEKIEQMEDQIAQLKDFNTQQEHENEELKVELKRITINSEVYKEEKAKSDSQEAEVERLRTETIDLLAKLELLESNSINNRLAEERAMEIKQTLNLELIEARHEIQRLNSQLETAEKCLTSGMYESSNIADIISSANGPLLDEISDLKSLLNNERNALNNLEKIHRDTVNELTSTKSTLALLESNYNSNLSQLKKEIEQLQNEQISLEYRLEKKRTDCEKNRTEVESLKAKLALVLSESFENLRNLKDDFQQKIDILKDERDHLNMKLAKAVVPHETCELSPGQTSSAIFLDDIALEEKSAVKDELENISCKYDSSLRIISELEKDKKQLNILEKQNRDYRCELKDLTQKYNELLELDGEKMEKIEELQHDIMDLRNLLKEQMLAFASR